MAFDKKNLLKRCLFFLFSLLLGSLSVGAITITRTSSPIFYVDSGGNPTALRCMYVSYQITNDGGYQPDVWVTIGSFTGGVISLAPNEDGVERLGAMNAGETKTAYFYIQASGATSTAQQQTISVYNGRPTSGGTLIASSNFSMTSVVETIQASANKVTVVTSGPNPATLGGTMTMTVTGSTGTIGAAKVLSFTPATYLTWAAKSYELYSSTIQLSGSNTGTYTDQLLLPTSAITSTADTQYTATYLFRAVDFTTGPTAVSPIGFFSSGTQVKHTDTSGYASLQPVQQITNTTVLSKLVNSSVLFAATTVTYTVRLTNSGSSDVSLDDIVDKLPTSPAVVSYIANSSSYGGVAIPDPAISGSTLTWARTFTVPAGQSKDLTYRVSIPATLGTYTNSATGHIASIQIDTTIDMTDNAPASVNVQMTTVPNISLTKCVYSGGSCVTTNTTALPGDDLVYSITFTNTGGYSASSFIISDHIPANTDFKVGSVTSSFSSTALTGVAIAYSNNNGSTWTYTPTSGGGSAPAGYDRNVTNIRWTFSGTLSQTANSNTGSVGFTSRIR